MVIVSFAIWGGWIIPLVFFGLTTYLSHERGKIEAISIAHQNSFLSEIEAKNVSKADYFRILSIRKEALK